MKKQSQLFDPTRFGHCLKRDLALDGRTLLLKWLVLIAALTALLYVFSKPESHSICKYYRYYKEQLGATYNVYSVVCILVLTIGASFFIQNMTSKSLRLTTIMLPSTILEKYLSRWTIYVLGVTLGFLAAYSIAEGLTVAIIKFNYGDVAGLHYVTLAEFPDFDIEFWQSVVWILAAQATFVLGSTIAPKNSYLKTAGVVMALLILTFMLFHFTFEITMSPGCTVLTDRSISLVDTVLKVFPVCWILFCHITAYYRMKESEIIERL